jgi:hypothetical protein
MMKQKANINVYEQQPVCDWLEGWLTLTEPSPADGPPPPAAASACESINRALMSLKVEFRSAVFLKSLK